MKDFSEVFSAIFTVITNLKLAYLYLLVLKKNAIGSHNLSMIFLVREPVLPVLTALDMKIQNISNFFLVIKAMKRDF